jgi:hypothetical protein
MIYKFSNTEIVVTTANTVYDNPLIRLTNPTTAVVNVTISVNSTANLYSFSILGNSEIVIEKGPTNRVQGSGVFASPVAYRY